nr:MAG TPA: hypothetical protein [Caudoviricetes sp.]
MLYIRKHSVKQITLGCERSGLASACVCVYDLLKGRVPCEIYSKETYYFHVLLIFHRKIPIKIN